MVTVLGDDWQTVLRAAFARQRHPPIDLDELLVTPEALAARGLTSALLGLATSAADRRLVADAVAWGDLLGFRAAGHGDWGQDLRTGYRPGDSVERLRRGADWQILLLKRYIDFRVSGAAVHTMRSDILALDSRLFAVVNAAGPAEIHSLIGDLGESQATRAARLAEYKMIGADLLSGNRDLVRPAPGPADGPGLPRRSWWPGLDVETENQPVDDPARSAGIETDLPSPSI